jgi:hypothetical protein
MEGRSMNLTPETLTRFCQDRTTFRPILDHVVSHDGLDEVVDKVIGYCQTRFLWQELVVEVVQENQQQFARFEPGLQAVEPEQPGGTKQD